jgi:hypothetical protein
MKGRLHNLSIECQLDLFDKIVKPILLYGCEVWGVGNNDIVERVHLKFCKSILHVKGVSLILWREILIEIVKKFNYLGILLK